MMKIIYSELLEAAEIELLGSTIERINMFIAPRTQIGELIISYSKDKNWKRLYHATLDGGAGDSCAAAKVRTLMNHPETCLGGTIPEANLNINEKKWYGSIRLQNCRDLEESGWSGEVIVAFSGRSEWQDVLYCAGIIRVIGVALKISFDLPKDVDLDPMWGTAINLCDCIV